MPSKFRAVIDFIKKPYTVLLSMNKKGEQFIALEQRLEDTRKIEDVAERVIAAEKLASEANEAGLNHDLDTHPVMFVPSLVPLGIVGAAIAAPFVAGPVLATVAMGAVGGLISSGVTAVATIALRNKKDEGLKSAKQVRDAARGLIADAPKSENFLSIAQSPLFDNVMAKYPSLKENFLLQAARVKTVQDLSATATAAPAPVPKNPLNP